MTPADIDRLCIIGDAARSVSDLGNKRKELLSKVAEIEAHIAEREAKIKQLLLEVSTEQGGLAVGAIVARSVDSAGRVRELRAYTAHVGGLGPDDGCACDSCTALRAKEVGA